MRTASAPRASASPPSVMTAWKLRANSRPASIFRFRCCRTPVRRSSNVTAFSMKPPIRSRSTTASRTPAPTCSIAKGEITAKYFEDDYKTRDTSASILLRQFGLSPVPKHEPVSAKHITLSTSATGTEGRTGQRLTLTVDGELAPKMHVYAPGTKGYIPIALTFDKPAGFSADPPVYPPAKTMRIKIIKETVPVYEGKFRVAQTIRLADAAELETASRQRSQPDCAWRIPLPGLRRQRVLRAGDCPCHVDDSCPAAGPRPSYIDDAREVS